MARKRTTKKVSGSLLGGTRRANAPAPKSRLARAHARAQAAKKANATPRNLGGVRMSSPVKKAAPSRFAKAYAASKARSAGGGMRASAPARGTRTGGMRASAPTRGTKTGGMSRSAPKQGGKTGGMRRTNGMADAMFKNAPAAVKRARNMKVGRRKR